MQNVIHSLLSFPNVYTMYIFFWKVTYMRLPFYSSSVLDMIILKYPNFPCPIFFSLVQFWFEMHKDIICNIHIHPAALYMILLFSRKESILISNMYGFGYMSPFSNFKSSFFMITIHSCAVAVASTVELSFTLFLSYFSKFSTFLSWFTCWYFERFVLCQNDKCQTHAIYKYKEKKGNDTAYMLFSDVGYPYPEKCTLTQLTPNETSHQRSSWPMNMWHTESTYLLSRHLG